MKTAIFMESTGVYHLSLFHFLNKNFDNTFVINPLVTKCNKNVDIRKVKNDKKDALSIAILSAYPTPQTILDAPKDKIIDTLIRKSRKGLAWAEKIYENLIKGATEASIIGLPLNRLAVKITSSINLINSFEKQIDTLLNEIKTLINSSTFPEDIRNNINLIDSIPGVGYLTAITIIAEIGDINNFMKPNHLVSFFDIHSSVNESGKFKGNQNKISKRETRIGRRALYAIALASIRKNRSGVPINKVLLDYYQINLTGKKPKVALVAIIHKILVNHYISKMTIAYLKL